MAQPYIGEIRMFAGNFPPNGWAFCNGQLIPISENDALFVLIGTMYGGDGQETFALPNLQSRVPMHFGTSVGVTYPQTEMAGVESVTLTTQQIPVHNHAALTTSTAQQLSPQGAKFATVTSTTPGVNAYLANSAATVPLRPEHIAPTGGSQPHDNMQPYLVINFIISLYGIFPQQT